MKITALTDGPLLVVGRSELVDQNGRAYPHPIADKFALCRCGGSARKPFCDGSHVRIGFKCPSQPEPAADAAALSAWESEGGSQRAGEPGSDARTP